MKRTPQVKLIRGALGLTQEKFAGCFHILLGTLRDCEQGAVVPDQSARAYLTVIAHDPEAVRKALTSAAVRDRRRDMPIGATVGVIDNNPPLL